MYMRKLSDRQWQVIEPLLPRQDFSRGGRPRAEDRKTLEGILWILRTGAQWDELPVKYGSPMTCWRRLKNWQKLGVWKSIWKKLLVMLEKEGKIEWEVSFLDGTFAPAKKGDSK
ncbi:hypothetical protein AUJ73_05220 [Candidatus Gottesmanbacteria bacterium CG1_02_37_22]|uniref:Insertion element IS402-like domain-containing protein n=4 Tax=Microgenomates group TaxID=1794810 RepID=A0A2H0C456_9BACT|nr:MAG: hypothetical protein AUJ73_05220 [Candidatus Gottesmanbacteria bacterium CG1_02_37_22]PIP64692.1 MAG: hypothetical protein COW96_01130 [Candidatus Roizmanbacteria bacterium CG22_combo_CG10-13_8_21_14_all_33_16]PIX73790.1 MAG: hypothetical protein COZ39_01800 [Candidatus Roizmanbacteria bacterium CG_4_10_14_3_um_filter_33_21]